MRKSAILKSRDGGSDSSAKIPVSTMSAQEKPKTLVKSTTVSPVILKKEPRAEGTALVDANQGAVLKRRKMMSISYKKTDGPKSAPSAAEPSKSVSPVVSVEAKYFMCMHTKRSNKKHKVYEDGVISVEGNIVKLFDMEAKMLGKTNSYTAQNLSDLHAGNELVVGARELEVAAQIEASRFISGQVFRSNGGPVVAAAPPPPVKFKSKEFKAHEGADASSLEKRSVTLTPRYDPDAPGAVVLSRDGAVPVVVDPHLGKKLRPHQREGVQFMYDCVMGVRKFEGNGCILADEMGLGKTLQAVTLIWTLLKTGPDASPVAKKVAVVTPTTLVRNWLKEFKRWLGSERVQPLSVDDAKNKAEVAETIEKFGRISKHTVIVLSYETFRTHKEAMTAFPLDLLVLDEGHRIKNVTAQISKALAMVRTRRRVLLTGTPLQNDLKEFYAMVDFCNPGILGTPKFFQEFFERPIMLSRDVSTSDTKRELGEQKFQELARITAMFMLRRTNQILEDYLPPKSDFVVFCRPSEAQVKLYRFFLGSKTLRQVLSEGMVGSSSSLECISILTKLCNHPSLVYAKAKQYIQEQGEEMGSKAWSMEQLYPDLTEDDAMALARHDLSGKLTVLDSLLRTVRKTTDDRVVIVSNFTKTLDIIQLLCNERGWKFVRLDGKTEQTKRQAYVDSFNRPTSDIFVFLLSSKAGGTGLNLIGANRLVLFDSDWNPAIDRQAMARVWRDGQSKRVYLYRLLLTGSIDEKVFQRQLSKEGLSSSVLDSSFGEAQFSKQDLKDIFSLNANTLCDTHDLICDCWRKGQANVDASVVPRGGSASMDISRWKHLMDTSHVDDAALKQASENEREAVTAVFSMHTDGKKYVAEPVAAVAEEEDAVVAVEKPDLMDIKDDSDVLELSNE